MDNNFLSGILAKLQTGILNRPAQANALPPGILSNLQAPAPVDWLSMERYHAQQQEHQKMLNKMTPEQNKWEMLQDLLDQARNPPGSHLWPRGYTPEQLQKLPPIRK